MENNFKSQIKTGAFVLFGLALTMFSVFMVGGDSIFKSYTYLYVDFEQVTGLNSGSVVSLSGLNVGNVEGIEFKENERKLRVKLKVDSAYLGRVTKDSLAEVRTQGALGDKYVYISPGTPGQPAAQAGDVIMAAPTNDILALISEKGKEIEKLFKIISDVEKVTTSLTKEDRMELLMANLTDASQSLKTVAQDSKDMVRDLKGNVIQPVKISAERLERILAKIDRGDGSLGALINDPSLHRSLKQMLGGSEKSNAMKSILRNSIEKTAEKNEKNQD